MTPRGLAAQVIQRVMKEGAYSHIALDKALDNAPDMDPRDRALATELVYGTLTWLRRLDVILSPFAHKGLHKVDDEVLAILRIAIYQIAMLDRIPERAAVYEAVEEAGRLRGGKRLKGFVNGVLRAAVRERDQWPQPAEAHQNRARHLAERWSMPNQLSRHLIDTLGWDEALPLAEALAERPVIALRATGDRGALIELLGQGAQPTPLSTSGVRVESLSGDAIRETLAEGRAVVQDEAAQLVSLLAAPARGERVLDACAGLGGKSAHLATFCGSEHLVAVDLHPWKLDVLGRTFDTLGLPRPRCVAGDLCELEDLGDPFDTIVVDAPCDGLGVLRRHPELRWRVADVEALTALQARLLDKAVGLLVPGGRLIYSVCTFTHSEGRDQVDALLQRHPEMSVDTPPPGIAWDSLHPSGRGWMALPHRHGTDGFFMARLRRT